MPNAQLLEDYLREVSQNIPIYVNKNETVLLLRSPEIIAISEAGQDLTNSIFFTRSAGNSQGGAISFNGKYFSLVYFPDNDILNKFEFPPAITELGRYSNPTIVGKKFTLEQYFLNAKTEPQTACVSSPIRFTTMPGVQPRSLLGRDCTLSSAFNEVQIMRPRQLQQWKSWPGGPGVIFERGEKAFSENNYEIAIENYIRCASILPNSQMLWDKLEETFERLHGNIQKTRAIQNIVDIAPHKSDSWLRKARLAEKFLFERTAVKFYETALGIDNTNDAAIISLSDLLLKIGRPRKIIRNAMPAPQAYGPAPSPPPQQALNILVRSYQDPDGKRTPDDVNETYKRVGELEEELRVAKEGAISQGIGTPATPDNETLTQLKRLALELEQRDRLSRPKS